jgi:2-hydroxychromene-2-carboxylate isomerase
MADSTSAPEIEFWFEFGSSYSYLSLMRIEDEARRHGVRIVWKPFLLGPVFQAVGFKENPLVEQKEKRAYVLRDMARECRRYGLRWVDPNPFPRLGLLALRIALLGAEQPWIGPFCRRVMERNYGLGEDINQPGSLAPILTELGLPASDLLDQARTESTKTRLRAQTEEAHLRGIFGAPTFLVGTEMFWGNDRLDSALLFASTASRCRPQPSRHHRNDAIAADGPQAETVGEASAGALS